ncbi:MAG TPA: VOC family protein [Solirubrobacterales bacterium]|nr:VOC family protein [Solirubrobacterales bacterium]
MSERTSYAPGTPCWVDLSTPDLEGAERFYGELFGWEIPELPDSAEMGGYRRARKAGKDVAGAMPLMQEGQPPAWNTHISVDDADAIARAIQENGGTMIAEPMAVSEYGRLAVFTDPEGAFFGIWEPQVFAGAELVNEPGTLAWNELSTRDPEAAKKFYGAVFGWTFEDLQFEGMGSYVNVLRDGELVGGMLNIAERGVPAEVPAHWQVYFAVEDTDATVELAKQKGGEVVVSPFDVPAGRLAILSDPFGAGFAVIVFSEDSAQANA